MWLTAEFLTTDGVAAAVSALSRERYPMDAIELFSDRPVELHAGMLKRPSYISPAAVSGAMLTGGLATGFVIFTQHNYPLVTGGMPLVSGWSTGVVSYEFTMAGAVAGVVLAFLWEGRLLFGRRRCVPPSLKEGSLFLQVECVEDSAAAAARSLELAGAVEIV